MDSFDEHLLVLERVTLGEQVELVVQVAVDLVGVAVLLEQAAQDADAADPQDLEWHARVGGTLSLIFTGVAALGLGRIAGPDAVERE